MKKYFNLSLLFVIVIFIIFLISPYIFKYHKYSRKTLQKETDYIFNNIEKLHIGQYLNENESTFEKAPLIESRMNKYTFYTFLWQELNKYFPEVYMVIPYEYKSTNLLPFTTRYLDDSYVVIKSYCKIPVGAKIKKINGINIERLYNDFSYAITGENEYVKKHNFTIFILPILPDFLKRKEFEVLYEFEGKENVIELNSITYEEYLKNLTLVPFEYKKINKQIGILKINNFNVTGKYFFDMLELLESIAKDETEVLLIDMRGCEGLVRDLSGIYMLLSFITDKTFYLSDKIFYSYGKRLITYEKYGYVQPNQINFANKKLYFISDKSIAHPLPMFVLSFVKKWKLGIIIGEKSTYPANFYGALKELKTTWTNIKVLVPTWYFENYKYNFVEPDIYCKGDYLNLIMETYK
ncbi:MAG: hypothetical protein H0Z24_00250 [Thermosipho sp. (in: Bacteria)]|nr:hypothetical protein [Thermosipho sp. (in: thermotogales)]